MRLSYHFKWLTPPLSTSLLPALLLILLSGCSTLSYYTQSIQGQLSLLYNREEIDSVINNTNESETLRSKLQQVKAIRKYASDELALPDNKSYLYYTDVNRPYVVWNVFAAPEFSLEPITWCYPIVGCVSYRGYFSENSATKHAAKLTASNNDAFVAGIAAYSTLGYFDDPALNTMLSWRERALAGLIFHELAHQVIYISNETGFNEAFASAVERIGSIQWLIENKPEQLERYLSYLNAQNRFRILLGKTRGRLSLLYASNLSDEEKRKIKARFIQEMTTEYSEIKQQWPNGIHFDAWFNKPANNARFTSSMTYLQQIPAFYRLFIEADGDWSNFFTRVKMIGKLDKKSRKTLMESKLESNFEIKQIVALTSERLHLSQPALKSGD